MGNPCEYVLQMHREHVEYASNKIAEYSEKVTAFFKGRALLVFVWGMKVFTGYKYMAIDYYNRSPALQKWGKFGAAWYRQYFCNYRFEPESNYWLNVSTAILSPDTNTVVYEERYDPLSDIEASEFNADNVLTLYHLHNTRETMAKPHEYDTLFTMKMGDNTIYRILPNADILADINITERSNNRFISVEYRHPRMEGSILLDIPPGAYLVNNEILSATFILRLLCHQYDAFVFDRDYKLTVVDDEVNIIEMKSSDYCQVLDGGYKIAKRNPETKSTESS